MCRTAALRRLALVAALATVIAACGTRVPDEVFQELAQGSGAGGGAAPGVSGGSDAAADTGAGGDPTAATERPATGEPGAGGAGGAGAAQGATASGQEDGRGAAGPDGSDAANSSAQNTASDVGVTADRILVGNITTEGGPLGPNQFTPMVQGAKAYFARLNARGGVNGRQVEVAYCDDKADPDRNRQCARNLVEEQGVFALVANSTRAYAGAGYVSGEGVPDVGGQPVGNNYFLYPTLFSIRGGEYPRDGEQIGFDGKLYNGTAMFRFLREQHGVSKAAVFYYDIPQSKAYGLYHVDALRAVGYDTVTQYEVNPALPSFDSYVADMQSKGIEVIFDTLDLTGNQNLCRSMERNGFEVEAKVSTVSTWSRRVERQFPQICKRSMYAWGETIPYTAGHEELATFRQTMREVYGGEFDDSLHIWHLEGWVAAKLFTEGVAQMGAEVTREGLIEWLNSFAPRDGWGAGGMIVPTTWQPLDYRETPRTEECIAVARWDLETHDFQPIRDFPQVCYPDSRYIAWDPAT